MACLSRSRTTSTLPACRRPALVRHSRYTPAKSAPVVERLRQAGALLVGKTNLDQFATGLVGVRSPYGVPRNPFDPAYIPGGSSSGSAVAVASGLVAFSIGTDTAGSGRVPASFGNIVGLKPTHGLVSTNGVVPACPTLDCVSIFALTVEDAAAVLDVARGFDKADGYSRQAPAGFTTLGRVPERFTFGVLPERAREFFGDADGPALYAAAIERRGRSAANRSKSITHPSWKSISCSITGRGSPNVTARYGARSESASICCTPRWRGSSAALRRSPPRTCLPESTR
jgi:allophanate hydrolase